MQNGCSQDPARFVATSETHQVVHIHPFTQADAVNCIEAASVMAHILAS
jgi:hypothetical protein